MAIEKTKFVWFDLMTTEVKIALSDSGCEPQPASVPAGPVTFTIANSRSRFVTEVELLRDNPTGVPDVAEWRQVAAASGAELGPMESDLP